MEKFDLREVSDETEAVALVQEQGEIMLNNFTAGRSSIFAIMVNLDCKEPAATVQQLGCTLINNEEKDLKDVVCHLAHAFYQGMKVQPEISEAIFLALELLSMDMQQIENPSQEKFYA